MHPVPIEIIRKLRKAGYSSYFVGGCVRDLVMGRIPTDYDIATSANPDEIKRLYPRSLMVGAQFGVVSVPEDDHLYEVATFRSDGRYTDGRHPDTVVFTDDPRQDVQRRDFTINGLLFDPLAGTVLDYVDGQSDIHSGVIRTIGDPERRFLEDRLRLIRAVRFAARFNFKIENSTLNAIHKLAGTIGEVSPERIRDEFVKILTEGYAARAIALLDRCELLPFTLPEVCGLKGVEQPPEFHPEGDVWTHTLLMLELMDQKHHEELKFCCGNDAESQSTSGFVRTGSYPSLPLAMGVLLHDIGKPSTFECGDRIRFNKHPEVGARLASSICERLRLSLKQSERIIELVRGHLKFKDLPHMRLSTLKRFLRQEGFEEHLELHRLDCLGSHRNLESWQYAAQKIKEFGAEEIRPKPLISGDDLIRLGYVPGPAFAKMLKSVEDAQLENLLQNRKDAEEFVLSHYVK